MIRKWCYYQVTVPLTTVRNIINRLVAISLDNVYLFDTQISLKHTNLAKKNYHNLHNVMTNL